MIREVVGVKRLLSIFLTVILCFALSSCGKADPIILPKNDDVLNISVVCDEEIVYHEDSVWIDRVISGITEAEPTSRKSVQDVPQVDNYIKIDFQLHGGISTVFVYEEDGKYYVEQPYQGIYELAGVVYTLITEPKEEK